MAASGGDIGSEEAWSGKVLCEHRHNVLLEGPVAATNARVALKNPAGFAAGDAESLHIAGPINVPAA